MGSENPAQHPCFHGKSFPPGHMGTPSPLLPVPSEALLIVVKFIFTY